MALIPASTSGRVSGTSGSSRNQSDNGPDQADAAGRDPQARARPRQADGVVDLDPFDRHIGIAGVADADAADEAVQLHTFDLDIGWNAAFVQPADQNAARRRPAFLAVAPV